MSKHENNARRFDPIASARISPPSAQGAPSQGRSPQPAPDPTPEPVESVVVQSSEPPAKAPKCGTIAKDKRISWGAQEIRLKAGQVISEESYGPNVLERMRSAGAEFIEDAAPDAG